MTSRSGVVLPVACAILLVGVGVMALRRLRAPLRPSKTPPRLANMLEADPLPLLYDQERPPGPQRDPFPGVPRAKVSVGGELRNALLLPTTSRFSVRTHAPRKSFLQIGAAVLRSDADLRRPGVTFSVSVVSETGTRRQLFSRFVDPWYNHADRSWIDARVALGAGSEDVTLDFQTTTDGAPPPGAPEYAVWSHPRVQTLRTPQRPNVVLISIDTLRADRLGCYGYTLRPTSPSLDRLASQGTRFARAYAQAPWTTPSHASMLTGLYASRHGVTQKATWIADQLKTGQPVRVLHRTTATLASRLREAGYDTAAFTGGATVAARLGFGQGFDTLREDFDAVGEEHRWHLKRWMADHKLRPFFLFFHTFEAHAPYLHGEFAAVAPDRSAQLQQLLENHGDAAFFFGRLQALGLAKVDVTSALYDGCIRHVDAFVGQLMQDLHEAGMRDETIVIVTSDHGEEFADHHAERIYNSHGDPMYEELLNVPLIVSCPQRVPAGAVIDEPVRSIDILPTVLELVGLAPPGDVDGRSLAPLWERGRGSERTPAILSEASSGAFEMKSLRKGRYKYIAPTNGPTGTDNALVEGDDELYDLERDPRERRNIVAERREVAAEMRAELRTLVEHARRSRPASATSVVADPELHDRLQALGYVR